MKRFHLVIGLMATLLMTKQVKGVKEYLDWTALDQVYVTGYLPRVAIYDPEYANSGVGNAAKGYDTAIEVHQGGQDGGGALW